MTAPTLTRPATGLMPPGWDPRPCVNKPPQWWDLGDEHNTRAVRYCRGCPLLAECRDKLTDDSRPKGQIRGALAFNETGKRIHICRDCDYPRVHDGQDRTMRCKCPRKPSREQLRAQRRAERAAAEAAKLARQQEKARNTGQQLIDRWLALYRAGLTIKQAAAQLGVTHDVLRNTIHRQRAAGDHRIPLFRAARRQKVAA